MSKNRWISRVPISFYFLVILAFVFFFAYYSLTDRVFVGSGVGAPAVVSIAFWAVVTVLILSYGIRRSIVTTFRSATRSKWFAALIPGYLSVHLLIYGIILEWILIGYFGGAALYNSNGIFLSGGFSLYPHTLLSVLVGLTVSPSITLQIEPYFVASISMYALATAVAIDVLVVANIATFLQLKDRLRRTAGSIAVPLIGVVLGAGCCLSIPELFTIAAPSMSLLLYTPLGILAQNIIYYLLPASVIVALAIQLNSISKIVTFASFTNRQNDVMT